LLAVNGFDEDYQLLAVGEDSDLEWRLRAAGIIIQTVSYSCITYHLHHLSRWGEGGDEVEAEINRQMMREKQKAGLYFCSNGIEKSLSLENFAQYNKVKSYPLYTIGNVTKK
jgi:GT2 family glycosyltransferase